MVSLLDQGLVIGEGPVFPDRGKPMRNSQYFIPLLFNINAYLLLL